MKNSPKRKLSAIVFTDIVGFTALSAKNEPAALELLNKQRELLKPIVENYKGTWLKEIGDGLLLTFNSSIEAVNCCVEIQKATKDTQGLNLRVAIHQGEVVVQGNDIIGDDVNIASRIEKYAASGGIAISGRVNASLERDPKFSTQYLGSPYLKGVSQEVKIYSIISHGLPSLDPIIEKKSVENQKMKWNIFSVTGAVLSIIGVLFWINVSFLSKGTASSNKIPSVVILPFENKGDSKEDFYAYGISSDIISDITGVGQLRVASLSSVEELQKEGLKNKEIAKKLSSRYVVSGSLWKIDSIFQLSMELFDTDEEKLLASQRWEKNWKDLSGIKKDLSGKIIDGLNIKIINELDIDGSINPEAYELYLKAKHTFWNRKTTQDKGIAMGLIEKALSLDPDFLNAKIFKAKMVWGNDPDKALVILEEANELALKTNQVKALMNIKTLIGGIFGERLELEKSLKYVKESHLLANELGNKSLIAFSKYTIGKYFYDAWNGDSARFYFNDAFKLYEELDNENMVMNTSFWLGLIYWLWDYDLDKALDILEKSYNYDGSYWTLSNIGEIYIQKNEFNKGLENYNKVMKHFNSLDSKDGIAHINRLYGQYYTKIHDYENEVKTYKISYELYNELKIERWKAHSLAGLIVAYKNIGDIENFQKYYEKSSEINTNVATDFYLILGFKLLIVDDITFARDCFLKQLKFEKENNHNYGIINTYTNIGLSYFYEDDFKNALKYFNNSIDHAGIKNLAHTSETLTHKHLCEKALGMPVDDLFLKEYIDKKVEKNKEWFKQEPAYMNWAFYKYFGDDKYILEAKRKIDLVLDNTPTVNVKKVSSYPIYQKILESFNQMQNL